MSMNFSWRGGITKTEYVESSIRLRKYVWYFSILFFVVAYFYLSLYATPPQSTHIDFNEQITLSMNTLSLIALVPLSLFLLGGISLRVRRLNYLGKMGGVYGLVEIVTIFAILYFIQKNFLAIVEDFRLLASVLVVTIIVSYFRSRLEKICLSDTMAGDNNQLDSSGTLMTEQKREADKVALEKLHQFNRKEKIISAMLTFVIVEGFLGLFLLLSAATSGHGDILFIVILLIPLFIFLLYLYFLNKTKTNTNISADPNLTRTTE